MKIKLISLIFLLTVLLSACSNAGNTPLDGTNWELVAISGRPPLEGTTLTLSFEDGLARGTSGCNRYGGVYQVDGEAIEFQEFESTVMACLEPSGVMEQESAYLEILGEAQRFEIVDGQLHIFGADGEGLIFAPIEQDS